MTNDYSALIRKDGEWWVGWIEEIPGVNAQEKSRGELIESLREALADILDLKVLKQQLEHDAILKALGRTEGKLTEAAKLLGVSRPTIYDLIEKYNIKQ